MRASENREFLVGAGTVLSEEQARAAVAAGAQFLVSPGLDPALVAWAHDARVTAVLGVVRASEVQAAPRAGACQAKFFPAGVMRGPALLRALAEPFPDMAFMPSGGISAESAHACNDCTNVLAFSGSWVVPGTAVAGRNIDTITNLVHDAVEALG